MRKASSLYLAAALLVATVAPALAQHGPEHHFDDHAWHGDIHHFHEYDFERWRGGHWYHGFHEGRGGWWWMIGDSWYFYNAPVYPYPDPYTPPTVVEQVVPAAPGVAPSFVYYCPNPIGYYPYIARCFAPWQRVAAGATVVEQAPPVMAPPQPAPPPMQPSFSREADDRELNQLAVEFQDIDLTGVKARTKLRNLEKKVEAFRQTLYTHGYDAMDIVRDADALEHRIAEQREKLPPRH